MHANPPNTTRAAINTISKTGRCVTHRSMLTRVPRLGPKLTVPCRLPTTCCQPLPRNSSRSWAAHCTLSLTDRNPARGYPKITYTIYLPLRTAKAQFSTPSMAAAQPNTGHIARQLIRQSALALLYHGPSPTVMFKPGSVCAHTGLLRASLSTERPHTQGQERILGKQHT